MTEEEKKVDTVEEKKELQIPKDEMKLLAKLDKRYDRENFLAVWVSLIIFLNYIERAIRGFFSIGAGDYANGYYNVIYSIAMIIAIAFLLYDFLKE